MFRQYQIESQFSPTEFLNRLRTLLSSRSFLGGRSGRFYGKVTDSRFDVRSPSSSRGNVIWVMGRIEPTHPTVKGTLRIVPEPLGSVGLMMIVALAIAIQFMGLSTLLRVALAAFAVLTSGLGIVMGRSEWRRISATLREQFDLTLTRR